MKIHHGGSKDRCDLAGANGERPRPPVAGRLYRRRDTLRTLDAIHHCPATDAPHASGADGHQQEPNAPASIAIALGTRWCRSRRRACNLVRRKPVKQIGFRGVTPVLPRNVVSGSFPALGSARPLSARRKRTRIGSAYSSASRFKRALMVTDIALALVDAP